METRQIHVRDLSTVTGIQQYEHCVQSIFFLGLEDFEGTIYLSIESDKFSEDVALTNNTFIIGQPMTKFNTTYTCQIYGIVNDGEKIQLSKQFRMVIYKSNNISGEAGEYPIDPNFENSIVEFVNEQKAEIDTYTDAQKSEIEATGQSVIESIPSDYSTLEQATYNAYPTESETGNPIYFDDGADDIPVKELIVNLEPKQDLNGYSNPWIGGTGKNLFKIDTSRTYPSRTAWSDSIPVTVGEKYTVSSARYDTSEDSTCAVQCFNSNDERIDVKLSTPHSSAFTVTIPSDTVYVKVAITMSVNFATLNDVIAFKPQFEKGASATVYAPYENICPISGYDGVTIKRTGKNLLPLTLYNGVYNPSVGSTMNLVESEATLTPSDDMRTFTITLSEAWRQYALALEVDSSLDYYANIAITADKEIGSSIVQLDSNYKVLTKANESGVTSKNVRGKPTLLADTKYYVIVFTNRTYTNDTITFTEPQIELGSTATEYEPYVGQEYSITFPVETGTVYGGRLNVTTGVLTVDRAYGQMTYAYLSGLSEIYIGLTDAYGVWVRNWNYATARAKRSGGIKANCNAYKISMHNTDLYSSQNRIYFLNATTSVEDFLNSVKSLEDNGDGLFIAYELATPTTVQLTPTEVSTLLGNNTISSDGSIDLKYRADTTKVIEKLTNAIVSLGGNV